MDSELLTCLLKFIEFFPDCLSALSRMLLRFFWTTFVETAVFQKSPEFGLKTVYLNTSAKCFTDGQNSGFLGRESCYKVQLTLFVSDVCGCGVNLSLHAPCRKRLIFIQIELTYFLNYQENE